MFESGIHNQLLMGLGFDAMLLNYSFIHKADKHLLFVYSKAMYVIFLCTVLAFIYAWVTQTDRSADG